VHQGRIIGEGYHRRYGEAHAEVNAVHQVENKSLLKASTLYVNLEPCSHYGKTPPCAEMIARLQIPEVIIGTPDPNPLVLGRGITLLKNAGCRVVTGILSSECEELNRRFFTFQKMERPYIILKWAETADGFLDKIRTRDEKPEWITNHASRILVHKWRSEEQAIMVGANTAIMDNPKLNVREWIGKNPVRIVIDNDLSLPADLELFKAGNEGQKTIIFTYKNPPLVNENIEFVKIPTDVDKISFVIKHLYCNKILSIIVEGGAKLIGLFLERNLWDEARVFNGKVLFHEGVRAPQLNLLPVSEYAIEGVCLKIYKNNR
jgi:diaminohydroxyphosphoribosylaminopyrimidine deaminase/5-amino-6-(5-phosphoribosylamino)uracil reductase